MTPLALALSYSGFTAVCLAMGRHHCQVWGRPPARRTATTYRVVGFTLILAALPVAAVDVPGSVGLLVWLGSLTVAALVLVLLLAFVPRAAVWAALLVPMAAAVSSFV